MPSMIEYVKNGFAYMKQILSGRFQKPETGIDREESHDEGYQQTMAEDLVTVNPPDVSMSNLQEHDMPYSEEHNAENMTADSTEDTHSLFNMFYDKDGTDIWDSTEAEILRVWGERESMTLQEIFKLLVYIPVRLIRLCLRRDMFIKLADDRYSLSDAEKLSDLPRSSTPKLALHSRDEADIKTEHEPESLDTTGIKHILKTHFPYGFRVGLKKEFELFRHYADEENIKLPESDDSLKRAVMSEGIMLAGMIFVLDDGFTGAIRQLTGQVQDSGNMIIFYEPFMNANIDILMANNITSVELFRDILLHVRTGLNYSKDYFTFQQVSEQVAVISDIRRIWSTDKNAMSIDEIAILLPYIPEENIKQCLSASSKFIRTAEGDYFLMDRFRITHEDRLDVLGYVQKACDADGYASIMNIPCKNVRDNNHELTGNGIYTAIFNVVLKGRFQRRHKIITAGTKELDITRIFTGYCKSRKECTVDEMSEFSQEITDSVYTQGILKVLYGNMVRLDAKRFVADDLVNFDVYGTDEAIMSVSGGKDIFPVKSINTFALFPDCGHRWNRYILESFCYRFSRRYRLHTLRGDFNSTNTGAIAVIDINIDYDGLLANVLAHEKFELTEDNAGRFLFESGYTGRAKMKSLRKIIEAAQKIRN